MITVDRFFKPEGSGILRFINTMSPLLVTGYQGLPILEVAKYMVKAKFCNGPCLECLTCQAVDNESSIHLKVIRPEGRAIKVDQVREVLDFLSLKREHITVVIFDQAHLMNPQAANALLKTLEEPPENCWILLTSPSLKNMLSTIRSRCLVYKSQSFGDPVPTGESAEVLKLIEDWLARFAAQKDELEFLHEMKSKEGMLEFIFYVRKLLKNQALKFKPKLWIQLMDDIQNCELALNSNVDIKLVEDQMLKSLRINYVFH